MSLNWLVAPLARLDDTLVSTVSFAGVLCIAFAVILATVTYVSAAPEARKENLLAVLPFIALVAAIGILLRLLEPAVALARQGLYGQTILLVFGLLTASIVGLWWFRLLQAHRKGKSH